MNIFSEVKEHLTARQAAEYYGLKVKRNGTACCPFYDDKHPSMKIEKIIAVLPAVWVEMWLIMFPVCLGCHSMMQH